MRFIVFTLVFFGGMFTYALLCYLFGQSWRNPVSKRIAILFGALSLSWLFELAAERFGYEVRPKYTTGFTISWWTARALKTLPAVWLMAYMVRHHKPQTAGNSEPATRGEVNGP